MVFLPVTVTSIGVTLACSFWSLTDHFPSAPATADAVSPTAVTVTRSPVSAVPHNGTGHVSLKDHVVSKNRWQ